MNDYSARIPIPNGWESEAWLDHLAADFDLELRNKRRLDPPKGEENVHAVFVRVHLGEFDYMLEMGIGSNYFDESFTGDSIGMPIKPKAKKSKKSKPKNSKK